MLKEDYNKLENLKQEAKPKEDQLIIKEIRVMEDSLYRRIRGELFKMQDNQLKQHQDKLNEVDAKLTKLLELAQITKQQEKIAEYVTALKDLLGEGGK